MAAFESARVKKRLLTADDLLRWSLASFPQLSPDGKRIALSLQRADQQKNQAWSHLWIVQVETGQRRQFTFGEVSDSAATWSPDGRLLAFIRAKDKRSQIWLMPADGGEACPLTDLPDGGLGHLCWSPEGRRLAFTYRPSDARWTQAAKKKREEEHRSTPPRVITRLLYREDGAGYFGDSRQHVWVCEVAPEGAGLSAAQAGQEHASSAVIPAAAQPRQLSEGDYDDSSPAWLADGSALAFISKRSDDPDEKPYEEDIWLISAEGGAATKLPAALGYKTALSCSPDGRHLAFFMEEGTHDPWAPRNAQLWIASLSGGAAQSLTPILDRTTGNVTLSDLRGAFAGASPAVWSDDSCRLYFLVSDAGNVHLYGVGLDGGPPVPLTQGALDVSALDGRAGRLALLAASPTEPPALYVMDQPEVRGPAAAGNHASPPARRLLCNPNEHILAQVHVSQPQEITVEGKGQAIQAWLLHPPDFRRSKRYPLLLYIHGGPHAQYGNTFFHEFQFLAARGYVVLYANPRGSLGYPEAFAAAIRGKWGELDYRDLMAVVDHACTLPYVDSSRLAVAGGSYGGYMTNWIVGHTDRFRCAITDRSVVNLHSMAGTCDFPFNPDGYWKGNWWDQPEELWQQSPLKHIANCKTPLLIIHSEGDLRCPIGQAEELYTALKRLKRKVVFIRYPAETSHGLSRGGPPDLRLDRLERIANWLDEHVKASG